MFKYHPSSYGWGYLNHALWLTLNFVLVLLESELSASTADMFEVVGQFLKCLGLLSQVGQYF